MTFTRKVEDFTCEHCGTLVKGDGYTNHCPNCLWSKHMDVFPGDREAACEGMMEPVEVILEKGVYSIIHKCLWCGVRRRNKTNPHDRQEALIALSLKNKD